MDNVQLAVDVDKKTFEQEQNELIKFILNERFFKPWEYHDYDDYNSLSKESSLEIFITSTCNQSCKYCYLQDNNNLYPPEINNKETILSNLQILCDWIKSRKFFIPKIELYSGEIWHSSYGLEVLEILYKNMLNTTQWVGQIIIPSNCSFVLDEIQLAKIQRYINKFRKIGVLLSFSISIDGMVIENMTRPLNNNVIKTEEFYERLFLFAKHNTFYFHPMISSESMPLWKENIKWWQNMCEKYDMDFETYLMFLEVRDPNWTEESIAQYCDLLDYLIDDIKSRKCYNNNVEFFKTLFGIKGELGGYIPYALAQADTFAGCSISNYLTVRLGDMAICPCHRTAYNKLLYGWFKIEDNKIIDIIGNNPQMAIRCLMTNNIYGTLKCDVCPLKEICLKGCFGSQYETLGDPFYPIENICNFFTKKFTYLIKKYCEMGILEFLNSYTPYYIHYPMVKKYKQIIEGVLSSELI